MGLNNEDIWILEFWKFALINGNFLANGESMGFWGLIFKKLLLLLFVIVYTMFALSNF